MFTDNPDPEWLEGKILGNADLCVLLPEEETLVTLYRDDLYMTVYNACGSVLKRLEQLAEAEELCGREENRGVCAAAGTGVPAAIK